MTVRRLAAPLAAVAAVAVLAGGYLTGFGPLSGPGPAPGRLRASVGPWGIGGAGATQQTTDPFAGPPDAPAGAPTRLRVPTIGVDTPLETLRVGADGRLNPPTEVAHAGWYADGTAPGDIGPAVIAGHLDSRRGPAVFARLAQLGVGDLIDVDRGGHTVRFAVTATARYPKNGFPTARVYGPTPDRQLRLITCGGSFDRSVASYRDNVVIYAVRS